jgi:hypothetical protein
MFVLRLVTIVTTLAVSLAGARAAHAVIINSTDGNDSPAKATKLTAGQLVVHDDLNGNVGRPDTLLAVSDPTFATKTPVDDDSSPLGNGTASRLAGVPLRSNGSAYFRLTGKNDVNFNGSHSQTGSVKIIYELFNSAGQLFDTIVENENVEAGMHDYLSLFPPDTPDPRRAGGTVTVTVNNVVGKGLGDSLDFFLFRGLLPNQRFDAVVTGAEFSALLGLFDTGDLSLLDQNGDEVPGLSGFADANGNILLGVSGGLDTLFKGEHAEVGTYTLEVFPEFVPEPSTGVLLVAGGVLAALWGRRARLKRRPGEKL